MVLLCDEFCDEDDNCISNNINVSRSRISGIRSEFLRGLIDSGLLNIYNEIKFELNELYI